MTKRPSRRYGRSAASATSRSPLPLNLTLPRTDLMLAGSDLVATSSGDVTAQSGVSATYNNLPIRSDGS